MPKRTPKNTDTNVTELKPVTKQSELAGIERPSHPELNVLMEEAAQIDSRMGADRQRRGEINKQLLQEAGKLKLDTYRHPTAVPELTLTVTERDAKVKVKKAKGDESEGDDE